MSNNSSNKFQIPSIDKLIYLGIFISLFILLWGSGSQPIDNVIFTIHQLFKISLICFIFINYDKRIALLLLPILIDELFKLSFPISIPYISKYISVFSLIPVALYFSYLTWLNMKKYKDFEMFFTLLTVGLFFPCLNYFLMDLEEQYTVLYIFIETILISSIMYNDNLWDRFQKTEKQLLLFLLILHSIEVLKISAKSI